MTVPVQASLAQYDHLLAQLLERIEAIKVQSAPTNTSALRDAPQTSAGKKKLAKEKAPATPVTPVTPTTWTGKKPTIKDSTTRTLVRQSARSATPIPPKKSPLQMVKQDHLEGFEHTKVSYSLHQ